MSKALKREISLERRLIESRERERDLMLDLAQLEDKLKLYNMFFEDMSKISVAKFRNPETPSSVDIHLRYDPAIPSFEFIPTKNNKEHPVPYHSLFGIFEMAKLFIGDGLRIRHSKDED